MTFLIKIELANHEVGWVLSSAGDSNEAKEMLPELMKQRHSNAWWRVVWCEDVAEVALNAGLP